jgi:hypothetical protein
MEGLHQSRVVLLLDSFEDELFKTLLELPHHPVKLILTTRAAPREELA